ARVVDLLAMLGVARPFGAGDALGLARLRARRFDVRRRRAERSLLAAAAGDRGDAGRGEEPHAPGATEHLPPDPGHRHPPVIARSGVEEVMADVLSGERLAHGGGDLVVARARAHEIAQRDAARRRQTGAELALRREADPVASVAEVMAHRRDKTDLLGGI